MGLFVSVNEDDGNGGLSTFVFEVEVKGGRESI